MTGGPLKRARLFCYRIEANRNMTPFEERLSQIIEPSLDGMGYELVRVQMRGETRKTLQIMAERRDGRSMTLKDCETVSKTVSALMDVHDPISERYALEISSPGIDRPLMKLKDYETYKGFDAKVDLKELYEGRRHIVGTVNGTQGDNIVMQMQDDVDFVIPFALIHRAKLLLTDELIAAHLKMRQETDTINQDPVSGETEEEHDEVEEI